MLAVMRAVCALSLALISNSFLRRHLFYEKLVFLIFGEITSQTHAIPMNICPMDC